MSQRHYSIIWRLLVVVWLAVAAVSVNAANPSFSALVWTNSGGVITPIKGPTNVVLITSGLADNATNKAFVINTANTWTSGQPLLEINNNNANVARFSLNYPFLDWASIVSIGYPGIDTAGFDATSFAIFNIGDGAGLDQSVNNQSILLNLGDLAGWLQFLQDSGNVNNIGDATGWQQKVTNSHVLYNIGHEAGMSQVINDSLYLFNFGHAAGSNRVVNASSQLYAIGEQALAESALTNSIGIYAFGPAAGRGLIGSFTNLTLITGDRINLSSVSTVTSGNLAEIANNGTNVLTIGYLGGVYSGPESYSFWGDDPVAAFVSVATDVNRELFLRTTRNSAHHSYVDAITRTNSTEFTLQSTGGGSSDSIRLSTGRNGLTSGIQFKPSSLTTFQVDALGNIQTGVVLDGAGSYSRLSIDARTDTNQIVFDSQSSGTGTNYPIVFANRGTPSLKIATNAVWPNNANQFFNGAGGWSTPTGDIASGTWTPTLTSVANLTGTTAFQCQYQRVGNVVTFSGKLSADPSLAATSTQIGISLPIASDFSAEENAGGTAFAPAIAGQGAAIKADATNDRLQMQWVSGDITDQPMFFSGSYLVQ